MASETGAILKSWSGRLRVALAYPNTYHVGMSNLGFQTVYQRLNLMPQVVCERVFLPGPADGPRRRCPSNPGAPSRISTWSPFPSPLRAITPMC